jgi:anti-sigma B factor antagonist
MPTELLKVSNLQSVNVVELFLPDDLDSTEFDRLNDGLATVFSNQPNARWILDLAQVQYLGSAALGLMVNIRYRVKSMEGRLALCNLSTRLQQIFKTCCLERLFIITRNRDDAVKAIR